MIKNKLKKFESSLQLSDDHDVLLCREKFHRKSGSGCRCFQALTNKDFPEIARGQRKKYFRNIVVTLPSLISRNQQPVIFVRDTKGAVGQCLFCRRWVTPLLVFPLVTDSSHIGVIIFHSIKRATRQRSPIPLTAEVLNYSFARAVCSCGHVDHSSFLFVAVESQLSERQVCSQFFHGIFCDEQGFVPVAVADFTV